VGQFTFDVTAAPTDVAAGDPVTVRSVIRGDGSLDGVAPPAVVATDRFRVYPTQATAPAEGSNERVFEQVVIPLRDGTLPLTLPRFSFFDPAARAYRTIAPAPITLTVRASAKAHAAPEIVGARPAAPVAPERPETLGRDIVFIKDAPGTLTPIGAPPRHRHPIWWLLQLIPILLWAGASQVARRRRRLSGDLGYARFTRAGREARTALAAAQATLARGDVTGSHDAVAAALRDYLAAKLGLPPGTVGESAPAHLRAGGVEAALVDQIVGFFTDCEAARFAPGDTTPGDVERALASADTIVRSIERRRGLGPARVAGCLVALAMAATAIAATSDGPSALFIRANGLYGEEHYAEAAATYEQILAGGVESGAVQFNLGNAYLKTGDVGHAVLAYERARRHIPGDPDLAANLGFARELAHDVIPPTLGTTLAFPFAERATTNTLATVTMAAWWTLWLALAGAALLPAAASVCRAIALASGFVATVAGSSGAYRLWTLERPTLAVVVARDDVTVRSEPTPNATALFVAKPGTVLEVDRTREGSSSVTSRDGRRGWVESPALAPL
jgi:tetratricopeptide (TPR) repeat protein